MGHSAAATVAAVFLIVAFAFRSLLAPIAALAVAGVAVVFTLHVGGALAARYDIAVPQEAEPLLIALLLGVVTDYAVFYLSAARAQLEVGADRLTAARWATAQSSPIIAIAGITAAAGTGALIVAGSPTFRAMLREPSESVNSFSSVMSTRHVRSRALATMLTAKKRTSPMAIPRMVVARLLMVSRPS